MSGETVRLVPFLRAAARPPSSRRLPSPGSGQGSCSASRPTAVTGWGEAAPLPGWSGDDLATVAATLERVAAAPHVREVVASLRGSARAAVAGALADLDARREGRSLASALTADPRTEVAVSAVIGAGSEEEVDAGCRARGCRGASPR